MTIIHDAQTTPHHYWPSWLHAGDCQICGHVAESPLHLPAAPPIRRDLFDTLPKIRPLDSAEGE